MREIATGGRRLLPIGLVVAACGVALAQQPPAPAPVTLPPWVAVKPIDPPAHPLPPEDASADVTQFSFFGYGDTRSGTPQAGVSGDGVVIHPEHTRIADRMIATAAELKSTPFPVRFVLQSGDAVLRGQNAPMWNVSFTPVIERLTRDADLPYFFSAGNHDVGSMPPGDPGRAIGLHNTLTAMSKVIPPEGSARRLNGYLTYAFGYGNAFVIALDSNIASDAVQLSWVTDQLERLDRARYKHVIVFFHHPPYSSGPHGGGSAEPVPGTGRKAPDRVEPQSLALRALYMPLFRKHHVRLLVTGHDHLFDHWVERYDDNGVTYRIDTIITGGGGAPRTGYIGEPDLRAYVAASPLENIRMEHLVKPGDTGAANPHHFTVIRVDGDRLSVEVIATGDTPYAPYSGGRSKIMLTGSGS